ncbi:uncharacterized protein LOC121386510 [Gigantopelta aegis]|uniref:uncharacterized protein LOC121386510 n=1 Tax=Gigantopelta aegis TaxID=1735272 RepID=UPI001B88E07E|nr:uncharacterized protein LOC121386510 [Gigantopelta aegis]
MSVVRKLIDLDFLARELRKHGKVLSRCDECSRLFTDVQKAMLHRKVHTAVTILLPRTLTDKHKYEVDVVKKEGSAAAAAAAAPRPVLSIGETSHDSGHLDYNFIMQALANANETMTFGDLEKLSFANSEKKNSHVERAGLSTEETTCVSSPFDECRSPRSNINTRVETVSSSDRTATVHVSDKDKNRTCSYLQPGSHPTALHRKPTSSRSYKTGVDCNTGQHVRPSPFPTCLQNSPESPAQNHKRLDSFGGNSPAVELLDSLDFSSANLVEQTAGSHQWQQQPSFIHDPDQEHLVQQIMGGSSFLQLLNEPLDESFDDLYNYKSSSSYPDHHNTEINSQGSSSCTDNHNTEIHSPRYSLRRGFHPHTSEFHPQNLNTESSTYSCNNQTVASSYQDTPVLTHNTLKINKSFSSGCNLSTQSKISRQSVTPSGDASTDVFNFTGNKSIHSTKDGLSKEKAQSANLNNKETQIAGEVTTNDGSSASGKDPYSKSIISLSLFPCKHCSLTFQTFSELIHHTSDSHNVVISKCSKCGQIFYDADAVKKHLLIHKPIVPLDLSPSERRTGKLVQRCQVCWQEFQNVYKLRSHMMSHPVPYVFTPESLSYPTADEAIQLVTKPSIAVDYDSLSNKNDVAKQSSVAINCDSLSDKSDVSKQDIGQCKTKKVKKKRKRKTKPIAPELVEREKRVKMTDDEEGKVMKLKLRSSRKKNL